jgi:signal transduction histidine kinase
MPEQTLDPSADHLADSFRQKGEQHFRRLLDKLPAGAYTCDPDGLITYYNSHAVQLWGREPKLNDPIDRYCGSFRLFAAADGKPVDHCQCWMALALRDRQEYNGHEIVVERPDGRRMTVLAHANPIHDDDGRLIGAVNVLVDIDARRRAEQAARQAAAAAEAANRAKDRFLAVLSHELRTPLSPVVMLLGALQEDPELPERFREDIALIRRNIDLETSLIDDLLDVSRVTSGKLRLRPEPLHLHDVLRHAIDNCASDAAEKQLHVDLQLDASSDHVSADPTRIQQVFWNLLRNAIKFTPAAGRVTVRTSNPDPTRLRVEVQDTGQGIPPDTLPRVFDAFEQGDAATTRQFGGLGLGLAIAKAVVEMHNGTIRAHSDGPDKGSTFTVDLPIRTAS